MAVYSKAIDTLNQRQINCENPMNIKSFKALALDNNIWSS